MNAIKTTERYLVRWSSPEPTPYRFATQLEAIKFHNRAYNAGMSPRIQTQTTLDIEVSTSGEAAQSSVAGLIYLVYVVRSKAHRKSHHSLEEAVAFRDSLRSGGYRVRPIEKVIKIREKLDD